MPAGRRKSASISNVGFWLKIEETTLFRTPLDAE